MYRRLFTVLFCVSLLAASPAYGQEAAAPDGAEDTTDAAEEEPAQTPDGEGASEASGATSDEPAPSADTVLGPGGKPLRTDYPGTEESLKARMDTAQIDGAEQNDAPQASYGLRIRELETKIGDLREKVFQSKTRIVLLRETLLSGNLAGARAVISHSSDLGSAFQIVQAYYALDGTRLANKALPDPDLAEKDEFQVYDGSISPGDHRLSILVRYRGTNVGIFPYFKGYDGDIKSVCDFEAQEGKISQVKIAVFPKGGIGQSIEQRPYVKCDVEYFDNLREGSAAASSEAPAEPAASEAQDGAE